MRDAALLARAMAAETGPDLVLAIVDDQALAAYADGYLADLEADAVIVRK